MPGHILRRKVLQVVTLAVAGTFSISSPAAEITFPENAVLGAASGVDSKYDSLFPVYAAVCTTGQRKKLGEEFENTWGHVVLYLNGACRDKDASFPKLKICPKNEKTSVIVSVNSLFKNVNWFAVEGRDLAFFGRLKPGQTLDQRHFDSLVDQILTSGALNGVEVHKKDVKDKNVPPLRYAAIRAVDTDLALTFGRNVHCAKMPITEPLMGRIISFLNERNEFLQSANEKNKYQWHYFYNNCAHLTHNSLSTLGFWEPKSVDHSWITQLFNLAIPANEFMSFAEIGNDGGLHPREIFDNVRIRNTFLAENWLPVRHGVLVESLKHHQPNKLYEGDLGLFILDIPFGKKGELFTKYVMDRRYTDLKTNLRFYETKYQQALKTTESELSKEIGERNPATVENKRMEHSAYSGFLEKYREYLKDQITDVQRLLSGL